MTDLREWIGRTEAAQDMITSTPAAALAATLNRAAPAAGEALPAMWHWLYFLPVVALSEVGPDGHPRRGDFLPPVPLPRRMWAGGHLIFHRPLRIGEHITRESHIVDVQAKQGRSGALTIVRVEHAISGEAGLALTDRQDLVYREAAGSSAPGASAEPADSAAAPDWSHPFTADPVLLFRYSALTFNGHRIHYDHPYATGVEGYPGLVVHGPLTLTLLVESLQREHPHAALRSLSVRALRPLFAGTPFRLEGRVDAAGRDAELWSVDVDGAVTMRAHALLA
jgi:3-methylfumaryl-CoA hydratase